MLRKHNFYMHWETKKCDSLYCGICFFAVVCNRTHNISRACLLKWGRRLQRANVKQTLTVFRNHIGGGRISIIIQRLLCICNVILQMVTVGYSSSFSVCLGIRTFVGVQVEAHCAACRILVLWPGIESTPSAMKAWSPNQWTAREFLSIRTLDVEQKRYRWNREEVN